MQQLMTDIVIVGGGTSGLAAALASAERGAKVIVVEKTATTGGTGNMANGPFAVESRYQRKVKGALTREEAFKVFMDYTHWQVDARMARNYIYKSADTIHWLEKMGVEFCEIEDHQSEYPTHHAVKIPGGGTSFGAGATMMKIMTDKARIWGVKVLLQATAKKILKENGCIAGVTAEDAAGDILAIKAAAVIVGTGGFGDNPEMIKKYTRYEDGRDIFPIRVPGMAGEGIRMAWEAGAAQSRMNLQVIFSLPPPFQGRGGTREELAAFRQPNLLVNQMGERFVNEETIVNTTYMGNAILQQKNQAGFMLFDDDTRQDYEKNGMYYRDCLPVGNLKASIDKVFQEGGECIYIAGSLEEMAAKTGINLKGLQDTVAEYNQACEAGRDDIFNKNPQGLRPIKTPPFYAGKLVPSAYGSLGGIKINYKTEIINKNFEPIPGFYAAGVDANTLYGDSYIYIMPGNTLGFALNSGRMAGENAAEYVKALHK